MNLQLARWKSLGFEFDPFYDTIAKDAKLELSIKFAGVKTDESFHIIKLAFVTKNCKSKNAILTLKSETKVNN